MEQQIMPGNHAPSRRVGALIALIALLLASSIGVMVSTANDIDLRVASGAHGLSAEENAYYEYVAPRLDRLVVEIDEVVQMVDGRSRDILALTISGNRIEELTRDITEYGEQNGVPSRFRDIHLAIVDATETATYTFDQARQALRTLNFSRMTGLVQDFQAAADGLYWADEELERIAGGTGDA